MKVLFVDQYSEIGGAQRCFLDLLPAMIERGWTVQAALPGEGPFVSQLRAAQIPVRRIRCGPYQSRIKSAADFARFPFDLADQIRTLRRVASQPGADLIYINGPRVLPGACIASMGRSPVLFHAHNRLNHRYETRLATWSLRASKSTVIACSRFVAEPLPAPVVVPNGTPDMGFRERRFDGGTLRIGMIGRLTAHKGFETFVEVVRSFPKARFVAVGQTVSLSAQHDVPIDFLGWRDDIATVLAQLDLLLIPSQQEGLPRVMLEAFSAGVPVIAFPAGGIVEAIRHRETGFLTTDFSAEAMTGTIRAAISDTGRLQAVAANARRQWEQCYNVALYRQRLIDLMERDFANSR
jgi:glycosyltransferase involved in cell wall biosynthesis